MRVRWLGRVPYREAWARAARHQPPLGRRLPAADGAPAGLHAGPQRRPRPRAGRPGHRRGRAGPGRPGRGRHLPRPRPAGRLPAPDRGPRSPPRAGPTCAGSSRWSSTPWSPWACRRAAVGRLDGYPGVWVGLDEDPAAGSPGPRKIAAIGVRTVAGSHHPRLRPQRDHRPRDVRPHRAVRDRRPTGDLAGRRRARPARWPRSWRRWSPPPRHVWGPVEDVQLGHRRCGVRRARCTRPAAAPAGRSPPAPPGPARRPPGRCRSGPVALGAGRRQPPRSAGWSGPGSTPAPAWPLGPAQAAVAAGPGHHGGRLPRSPAGPSRTSTWSRCARRPAAPTSTSAGPTAPPPS